MSRVDTDPWETDWELTGSPLNQGHLKPDPLWSYHASIEAIKNSPSRKFSQDQSRETSRFFTLETTVTGSLFSSNDAKGTLYREDIGGNDHSLPAHRASPSTTTSLSFLSLSKPLPASPRPSQARKSNWSSEFSKVNHSSVNRSNRFAEETKDCAGDNEPTRRSHSHEETISRYEKLRKEKQKIRHKIAQRRIGRQEILSSDSIKSRRKSSESQNAASNTDTSATRERCSRDGNNEVRSNAAILIQCYFRRMLAAKDLAAKKAAKQEAESKRLPQLSYSNYSWNRTARVNNILAKIKAREFHHRPSQLGHLYTIHEE